MTCGSHYRTICPPVNRFMRSLRFICSPKRLRLREFDSPFALSLALSQGERGCAFRFFLSPKLIYYQLEHQPRAPKSDRGHAVREHCKQWRSLVGVIRPTLTRRAPQLKIISEPRTCEESQQGKATIGWSKNEQ